MSTMDIMMSSESTIAIYWHNNSIFSPGPMANLSIASCPPSRVQRMDFTLWNMNENISESGWLFLFQFSSRHVLPDSQS